VAFPGFFFAAPSISSGLLRNLLLFCTAPYDNVFNDSKLSRTGLRYGAIPFVTRFALIPAALLSSSLTFPLVCTL
jgi:hypothetical protein